MSAVISTLRSSIKDRFRLWLAITFGAVALYYAGMMAGLIFRFGSLPNYTVFYDWIGNIALIIRGTPSVQDMVPIMLEEWLIEIGYMNSDYGSPISVWSLTIIPSKVILSIFLGALIATYAVLFLRKQNCSTATLNSTGTTAGVGSALVLFSNLTMSWVVCCSTPSWVVGLAMMGLGVSTSLALEPYGLLINSIGFALLIAAVFWTAWRQTWRGQSEEESLNELVQSGSSARPVS